MQRLSTSQHVLPQLSARSPSSEEVTLRVSSQVVTGTVVLRVDKCLFTVWDIGDIEQSKLTAEVFESCPIDGPALGNPSLCL